MPSRSGFFTSKMLVKQFGRVLFLIAFSSICFSQSDQPKNALASLDMMASATEKLQMRDEARTPEFKARLEKVKRHISELQNTVRYRPAMLGAEPRIYRENLESFSRVLMAVAENPPEPAQLKNQLDSIEWDLEIKLRFAASSRGEPLGQIQTVVYTVDTDNRAQGGYEIWYVPKGLEDYKAEYKRFDNLSTPAIMALPPGNYVLWTMKDNVTSDRRPLTLGDDRRSKRELTLVVK
jgi:hypothetical protein